MIIIHGSIIMEGFHKKRKLTSCQKKEALGEPSQAV